MGSLSFSEIFTILVIILIIFGPKRLPEFARKVGEFIAWGRRSMQEFTATVQREMGDDAQPLIDLQTEIRGAQGDFSNAVKAVSGPLPSDIPDDRTTHGSEAIDTPEDEPDDPA